MISYEAYKIVHLLGIGTMMVALSGACFDAAAGSIKQGNIRRRLAGALHGFGALISLVAGFGLMARLALGAAMPGWIWVKLLIWIVLAASFALPYRWPRLALPMAASLPLILLLAAILAILKPF